MFRSSCFIFLILANSFQLGWSQDLYAKVELPSSVSPQLLQEFIQKFVNAAYLKSFVSIGDERDFDHGHILLDSRGKAFAILYHTQEKTALNPGQNGAHLDPKGRNWIQWLDTGKVEDARLYARHFYPASASWAWFTSEELPRIEEHYTILDKMLDPALLGTRVAESRQCVFTREPCRVPFSPDSEIRVVLPTSEIVCLTLSSF